MGVDDDSIPTTCYELKYNDARMSGSSASTTHISA